nr:NAD(P)H-hydrate dehydratase [Actinomycetota bacterium]
LSPHLPAPTAVAVTRASVASWLRAAQPTPQSHKYTRGVVGVAAGSAQYTGAGVLAVSAANCGLAGMVRYRGPAEVADLVRNRHPEVVVGAGRVQAWVVGSGGGDDTAGVLDRAVADQVPLVVDADALQHVTAPLSVPALLTPHAGELARMLDVDRGDVEVDPMRYARSAAERFEAAVLLKGHRTVIAPAPTSEQPAPPVWVNTSGTPWLATAGAGDVLAGLCGALLAARPDDAGDDAGDDLGQVGAVGAWLHGAAATYASQGAPITAADLLAALPSVIGDVLDRP